MTSLSGLKIYKKPNGYTLIELTVVILLIGILLSVTLPRIQDPILTDDFKGTARRIINLINQLKNDAIRDNKDYSLHLDLESNRYWVEYDGMTDEARSEANAKALTIPEGVRMVDIWLHGSGKKMAGEADIWISRKGYIQPAVIHLRSEDDREFTLILKPFSAKVELLDRYVEFEDI